MGKTTTTKPSAAKRPCPDARAAMTEATTKTSHRSTKKSKRQRRARSHAAEDGEEEDVECATLSFEDALSVGLAFQQLAAHDSAVEAFERAVALRPGHFGALTRLAETYTELGRPTEAITCYTRASALPEADAGLWLRLGMSHAAVEETDAALTHLERARTLAAEQLQASATAASADDLDEHQRTFGMALAAMAQILGMERGDVAAAVKLYEDAVQVFPDNANLHFNLATMQQATGERSRAVASLERAIACDDTVIEFYEELLECLREEDTDDERVERYRTRLEELRQQQHPSSSSTTNKDDGEEHTQEDAEKEEDEGEEENEDDSSEEEEEEEEDDDDEEEEDED